jgi:hypothetical protein
MPSPTERTPLSRRSALKWLAGTSAAGVAAPAIAAKHETEPAPAATIGRSPIHDPDYAKPVFPWQKVFTPEELATTTALADLILPKDANGPAASEVGVPDFINEWCSAPYEDKREDCELIRGGLGWLSTESFRRFSKRFEELSAAQQSQIADDICDPAQAKPEHKTGASFFRRFRSLSLSGYYTHSSTWKHLGYIGNVSLAGAYPGVPQEVIEKLGLQDVA